MNEDIKKEKEKTSLLDKTAAGALVAVFVLGVVFIVLSCHVYRVAKEWVNSNVIFEFNLVTETENILPVDTEQDNPDLLIEDTRIEPLDTADDFPIVVIEPESGQRISSPLRVYGHARGTWFFEANAPLILTDWDGRIIGESYISADGNWMTEDYVPFSGEIVFDTQASSSIGALIFQKANPSGLPQFDDALEIQIRY